ncbi:MAG: M50 family metallopeptidase [Candidatus Aenigmatarchaeota archaeon]
MLLVLDSLFIILVSIFLTFLFSDRIVNKKGLFLILFSSIFLHELAHKVIAYRYGYVSYIASELSLPFLILSIILYYFLGVLIPPPIYTRIFAVDTGTGLAYTIFTINRQNAINTAIIAFAGPLTNLILGLSAFIVIKLGFYHNEEEKKFLESLFMLNLMLFIINMIPFEGTDGYWILESIKKII